MKRLSALLLVLMMVISVFAGCSDTTAGDPNPTTSTPTQDPAQGATAQEAVDYLKGLYKDDGSLTAVNYDRFKVVRIAGVKFDIVWSVDVAEDIAKIVEKDEMNITVDVNEACTEDTEYVLTATATDAAGNTASASWKHIIPAAVDQKAIVEEAYALESGAAMDHEVTLTGKIVAVNTPYDADYKNVTVTIAVEGCEDKPIMCYRLKGEGAEIIDNGWVITVTGIIKNYNGTIEFDSGCVLNSFEEGEGVKAPEDPTQIVDEAYALEENGILPYTATLTGEVSAIDSPYSDQYKNITVDIKVAGREDKPIKCYRLKGDGVDQIMPGDIVTVTGNIKNYKGTIEFDAGCILKSYSKGENSFVMPETEKEIVELAYSLNKGESLPVQVTLTGLITSIDDVYSERYENITVTVVVDNDFAHPIKCYRMKGDDADKIWTWDTISVTGTLKNYDGVIEFDAGCTLNSWEDTGKNPKYPTTQVEIVDTLYALEENTTFHGMYSLTGRVTVASAYSLNYGNQDLTIEVPGAEGKPVICYRMTTGGIMDIKAGDYVTVRGNLEDYKGKKQLTSGYLTMWDPTTLEEAIEEAKGLANNDHLPYDSTITGTIKIDTPYSAQYGNITFTVTAANGTSIQAYRIKGFGADQLVDGDVVTVTGPLTAYKGKPQFDAQASFVCQRVLPKTLAEQLEAAKSLADKAYLPVESTATGIVTIKTAYDPSYKNVTFNVTTADGLTIYCYRIKGTGMDTLADGDTVTITGYLTAYKGTPQFDSTAQAVVVAKGEGSVTPPVTPPGTIPATFAEQMAQAVANGSNDYESTLTAQVTVYTKAGNDAGHHRFTISDGTVTLECYYSDCGDYVPAVGDTVTVTGKLGSYSGNAQFTDSAKVVLVKAGEGGSTTPTIPATLAEQIEAAKALGSGSLPYDSTITGTVVITGTYDASYKNVSFNVTNTDGITLFCKYTSGEGMDTLADGDTVTVTGKLECYNGNAQFYKATAVVVKKADGSTPGSGTVTPPVVTPPAGDAAASISFADAANRVSFDTESQVWAQNGVNVTNLKGSSTNNVADYVNPARFYKNSSLTISYPGMTKIEFVCNSASYATVLQTSLTAEGVTCAVSESSVYVELSAAADTFSINALSGGQVRMNQINVFTTAATDPGEGGEGGETELTAYAITFDNKAVKRTEYSTEKQVWEENGITVTNLKSASASNVGDYEPLRIYAGSNLTVSFKGIKKIVFDVNSGKPVDDFVAALEAEGYTCTVDGNIVTVELTSAVDAFVISTFAKQVRLNGLTVYA